MTNTLPDAFDSFIVLILFPNIFVGLTEWSLGSPGNKFPIGLETIERETLPITSFPPAFDISYKHLSFHSEVPKISFNQPLFPQVVHVIGQLESSASTYSCLWEGCKVSGSLRVLAGGWRSTSPSMAESLPSPASSRVAGIASALRFVNNFGSRSFWIHIKLWGKSINVELRSSSSRSHGLCVGWSPFNSRRAIDRIKSAAPVC